MPAPKAGALPSWRRPIRDKDNAGRPGSGLATARRDGIESRRLVPNFSYGELKIFSGRAHPALAREICAYLGIPLGQLTLYNFSDGENYCQIDENVRGADVFIVQPT